MPKWNALTERWLSKLTNRIKRKRVDLFVRSLGLGPGDAVLDLGSEDGSYLSAYYPYPENITIADIAEEPMKRGVERFGLKGYILIPTDGPLPIETGQFDAVWCNSVIEHVTLGRAELPTVSHEAFRSRADEHQRAFAREIARVARQYFVQTPCLHFPIESHSWLPFVQYLRHERQWRLSNGVMKSLWVKQWRADFYLYAASRFRDHFPDATGFHVERFCGLPKSQIAIRSA